MNSFIIMTLMIMKMKLNLVVLLGLIGCYQPNRFLLKLINIFI